MADHKTKQFKSVSGDRDYEKEGLLSSFAARSSELTAKAVGTGFDLVRDVRQEIQVRVANAIDFAESSQQGLFKLARSVNDRVHQLVDDGIGTAEELTLGVVRLFGETGQGAAEVATQAATSLFKAREESAPQQATRATAGA